jgi:hypothetical protein
MSELVQRLDYDIEAPQLAVNYVSLLQLGGVFMNVSERLSCYFIFLHLFIRYFWLVLKM